MHTKCLHRENTADSYSPTDPNANIPNRSTIDYIEREYDGGAQEKRKRQEKRGRNGEEKTIHSEYKRDIGIAGGHLS